MAVSPKRDWAVTIVTVQLFAVIYLQRFALGTVATQVSVPLIIIYLTIGGMALSGVLRIRVPLLSGYLAFAACCLWSYSFSGGSPTSIGLLLIIYGCVVTSVDLSPEAYLLLLRRYMAMMALPAGIVLIQYGLQKVTGGGDPISMTGLVPEHFILQGYFYEAHYPPTSSFMRPNGFFFLEPSFVSVFTAAAAIIELTHFRRPRWVLLMIAATGFSTGATGVTMLVLAAPILLYRQPLALAVLIIAAGMISLSVAYAIGLPLPLMSRISELNDHKHSSAAEHLLISTVALRALDFSYLFGGDGAGSLQTFVWPSVKLVYEYGIVATIAWHMLWSTALLISRSDVALKFGMVVMFMFTGAYLLNPPMALATIVLCVTITPIRSQNERRVFRDRRASHEHCAPGTYAHPWWSKRHGYRFPTTRRSDQPA